MTDRLHSYYFSETRETVVARTPELAVAFYAMRHNYTGFTYEVPDSTGMADKDAKQPIGLFKPHWGHPSDIYQEDAEYSDQLTEGTILQIPRGHSVSTRAFEDILSLAPYDRYYLKCNYDVTDLHADIILPLSQDIEHLTPMQLEQLAQAIRHRRDFEGDMVRTLGHLLDYNYDTYMEHIYPIVKLTHQAEHDVAIRLLERQDEDHDW
jgi:hypothetical protein